MRRAPRARGVFSRIRPTASAVIRNHTCWLPSASSAAPNQRIRPLGSRVGSRGVRVWAPPGQSSRVPAMTIFGPGGVGHAFPPAPPKLSTINRHSRRPDRPRTRPQPISPNPTTRGAASSTSTTETAACFPGHCPPLPADRRGDPALPWPERVADAPSAPGRAVAASRSSGVALGRNRLDAVTAGLLLHGLDVPGVAAATAGDGIAAPPPARTRRASSRSRSASRRTPETARRHPVRRRRSATAERRRLPRLRRPPAPRPPALGHLSPPPTPPSTSPSNRS